MLLEILTKWFLPSRTVGWHIFHTIWNNNTNNKCAGADADTDDDDYHVMYDIQRETFFFLHKIKFSFRFVNSKLVNMNS